MCYSKTFSLVVSMPRIDFLEFKTQSSFSPEQRIFSSLPAKEFMHSVDSLLGVLNETDHIVVTYDTEDSKYVGAFTSAIHFLFYNKTCTDGAKIIQQNPFQYFKYCVESNPSMSFRIKVVSMTNNEFRDEHLECLSHGEWFSEAASYMEPFLGWEDCLCPLDLSM